MGKRVKIRKTIQCISERSLNKVHSQLHLCKSISSQNKRKVKQKIGLQFSFLWFAISAIIIFYQILCE